MKVKPIVYFFTSNDLCTDQRMHKICGELSDFYQICLVGRRYSDSATPDIKFPYFRFHCFFRRGKLFYLELNWRIFWWLIFKKWDAVCAVDTDTLAACGLTSLLTGRKLIFDAHEFFTETPELGNRNVVRFVWRQIERYFIPQSHLCYTVSKSIADRYSELFRKPFYVVRNLPYKRAHGTFRGDFKSRILWYQGALNRGRGLESIILALDYLKEWQLVLVGDGDILCQLKELSESLGVKDRVEFRGKISPIELNQLEDKVFVGFNLLDSCSKSYYYSLANKFFDYVQQGIPQITMDFPEYRKQLAEHAVGLMLPDLNPKSIAEAVLSLSTDHTRYSILLQSCLEASCKWVWPNEGRYLKFLYHQLLEARSDSIDSTHGGASKY